MAAALQLLDLGITPLVVEQLGAFGGSYIGTEFITGIGNQFQAEAGIQDSVKTAINEHLSFHHWIPNRALTNAFLSQTADTIEWFESHGMGFEFAAGYLSRGVAWEEAGAPMRGMNFVNIIGEELTRLGVETRFNTTVRKILVEGGKATSILAEDQDGTVVKIESPVVIIGTGGYANNEEFRRSVASVANENVYIMGMDCRNADGIKMAADAGAAMAEGLGTVQWSGPVIIGSLSSSWQTDAYVVGVQPMLWVNQDAERFMREDLWMENFPAAGMCLKNQKRTYTLFTEADMNYWTEQGAYNFIFGFGLPGTPLPTARETIEGLDSVHIGDSLEAVATAAGLDPAALQATVENYNALCKVAQGKPADDLTADDDFGKQAQFMHAVEEGPFWLCEASVSAFTTHGGIKVNEKTEVLDTEGTVIGGLYAGGADAGGLCGDSYDVLYCPGSAAGWAVNLGRLAAKSAAEFLG
jgi:fumarate reductase flavoprotein subunit